MKILIIDNYDSFTYNIVSLVRKLSGKEPAVKRNDVFEMEEVKNFDKIILSPGPGIPSEAGQLNQIIKTYAPQKSILGICLGHQAIGEAFGAKLLNMNSVRHGISSRLRICKDDKLFEGLGADLEAGHYHSWIVDRNDFPDVLEITMEDQEGKVMALRHKIYDVRGLQFHPESILTPEGGKIISNWIKN